MRPVLAKSARCSVVKDFSIVIRLETRGSFGARSGMQQGSAKFVNKKEIW